MGTGLNIDNYRTDQWLKGTSFIHEPHCERAGLEHSGKQRHGSAVQLPHTAGLHLCFRYMDSRTPPLVFLKFQASSPL